MDKQIYNDSFYYSEDHISYFITNIISDQIEFFQDISSQWWQSVRNDERQIQKYIKEKFSRDFYPRVVAIRNKQFDLDYDLPYLKSYVIQKICSGSFSYRYEQEKVLEKTTQLMHAGIASIIKETKKYSPRIAIKISLV